MKIVRSLSCAVCVIWWLGAAGSSSAAPFDVGCPGATDVDTDPATVVTCNIAVTGTITDLNVTLVIDDLAAAQYATDLQIFLVHVATSISVAVFLGSEVINPQSLMDAIFDDSAVAAPPGSGDIIGTYLPAELLSTFNGLELSGAWNLEILDASAYPDEGIDLLEWRLTGSYIPEPGGGLLLALGLFGLVVLSGQKHEADLPKSTVSRR